MKTLTLENSAAVARELKKATGEGYLVLTRNGKPIAYVLPTALYDEEDIGYMTDPEFWKMIAERRKEKGGIPLEQAIAELEEREKAEKRSRTKTAKKPRNGRSAA